VQNETETVTLNLPDEMLFKLMVMAHEEDVTFNQFVNNIIKEELAKDEPFAFLNKSS
jgi:ATP-dependent Clp protease adapter protein ClpS